MILSPNDGATNPSSITPLLVEHHAFALLFLTAATACLLQKDRLVHSSHPGPAHEEEVSSEVRKIVKAREHMLQCNTPDFSLGSF